MQTPLRHLRICLGALVLLAAPRDGDGGRRRQRRRRGPPARPRSRRAAGAQPDARDPLRRPAGAVARVRARFPRLSALAGAARAARARRTRLPGQSSLVLHAPPLVPMDLHDFAYTGVVPNPWLQLNFIYGNSTVSATVILAGTSALDAAGYYDPVDQLGVNDAFLTVNLTKQFGFPFQLNVGAYTGRYGAMGIYDAGRYGTPLIAQTNTIGENITPPTRSATCFSCSTRGWAGSSGGRRSAWFRRAGTTSPIPTWARRSSTRCTSGVAYRPLGPLGLHYLTAWTQDDLTPRRQHPGRAHHRDRRRRPRHRRPRRAPLPRRRPHLGHERADGLGRHRGPECARRARAHGPLPGRRRRQRQRLAHHLRRRSTTSALRGWSSASCYTGVSPDVLVSLFGIGT